MPTPPGFKFRRTVSKLMGWLSGKPYPSYNERHSTRKNKTPSPTKKTPSPTKKSPSPTKKTPSPTKEEKERDEKIFKELYTREGARKFRINSEFPEFVHSGDEKKYMQSIIKTLYDYDPSTYDYRSEPAKPMTFVRGEEETKISPFEYFYDLQGEKGSNSRSTHTYKLDHRSLRIERKRINNRE